MPGEVIERWEFFQDGYKNWKWRKISADGQDIVDSAESYSTRKACVQNARQHGFKGKINIRNCKFISFLVTSI
jgi:hypothetical protein